MFQCTLYTYFLPRIYEWQNSFNFLYHENVDWHGTPSWNLPHPLVLNRTMLAQPRNLWLRRPHQKIYYSVKYVPWNTRGFGLAICFCLWSKLYKYWNTHFRFQDWENFAPSFVCIGGVRKQNSSVSLNPTWKAENISKTLTLCQFSIIFSPYSHFLLTVALQKWSWDFLLIGGKGHENPRHTKKFRKIPKIHQENM